jgi:hypothetical protein
MSMDDHRRANSSKNARAIWRGRVWKTHALARNNLGRPWVDLLHQFGTSASIPECSHPVPCLAKSSGFGASRLLNRCRWPSVSEELIKNGMVGASCDEVVTEAGHRRARREHERRILLSLHLPLAEAHEGVAIASVGKASPYKVMRLERFLEFRSFGSAGSIAVCLGLN